MEQISNKTCFKVYNKKEKQYEHFYLTLKQLIDGDVPDDLNSKDFKLEILKF